MYATDYNVQALLEDRLREAENQRKHNDLIRAARDYARREGQVGLIQRIKQWAVARNQPQQETADVRHAPAL